MHANLKADCRNDQAVVVQQAAVHYFIPLLLRRQRTLSDNGEGDLVEGRGVYQEQDMCMLT